MVSETKERFRKFLEEYKLPEDEETGDGFDPSEPLYMQKLQEVSTVEGIHIQKEELRTTEQANNHHQCLNLAISTDIISCN